MSSYRKLVITALILLFVGGGLAIWNAERKAAPPPADLSAKQPEDEPSMVGKNVSFIVTDGEVKKWKLEAETANYNETRTAADLTTVKGEFYDKTGKPVLQFSAPKGKYTNKDNAVTLTGGVVAKSLETEDESKKDGELRAPKMVWSAKTSEVTASGGAELIFPQGKSTAETCRFTLDFSHVFLEGNVVSAITAP